MTDQKRNQSAKADKSPAEIAAEKIHIYINHNPLKSVGRIMDIVNVAFTAERAEAAVTLERHDQMAACIEHIYGDIEPTSVALDIITRFCLALDNEELVDWLEEAAKRYEEKA